MDTQKLCEQFLKSIFERRADGKWAFSQLKTAYGLETRSSFLDACSELFVPLAGQPKPVIYEVIREALRQRGSHPEVQAYGGMVLLNLVPDAYGQVDELIDIVAPVFDLSNREIPAFLVEQVGLEALLQKIETRKTGETRSDVMTRLSGLAYQARVYQAAKTR